MRTDCHKCGAPATFAADDEGPLCASCAEKSGRLARGPSYGDTPSASAGMIIPNVRGVDSDGKRVDGAESWEYRPPQQDPDQHHDQHIIVGNTLQFQQSPPIHVGGSAPKSVGRASRGAARSEARQDLERIEELVAEAGLTEREREVWRRRKLLGERVPEIAENLGMTRTAVKKALERAQGKVRKEIPQF